MHLVFVENTVSLYTIRLIITMVYYVIIKQKARKYLIEQIIWGLLKLLNLYVFNLSPNWGSFQPSSLQWLQFFSVCFLSSLLLGLQ